MAASFETVCTGSPDGPQQTGSPPSLDVPPLGAIVCAWRPSCPATGTPCAWSSLLCPLDPGEVKRSSKYSLVKFPGIRDSGNWERDEMEPLGVNFLRNMWMPERRPCVTVSPCLDCKGANCLSIPAFFTEAQRRATEVTDPRRLCRAPLASDSFINSRSSEEQTLAIFPRPRIRWVL